MVEVTKREQEYWNEVGNKNFDISTELIKDNFGKRRLLVPELLKYDFEKTKVLELGTGLGVTAFFAGGLYPGFSYQGMDISETFARAANQLFGLKVTVGDAGNPLPFKDEEFNAFWAFDTLEHIHPNKRPMLFKEIDRVLKKDTRGIFILNPLSESRHDPEFDFWFDWESLVALMKATDTQVIEVKYLHHKERSYQFIALSKVDPHVENACI